MSADGTAEATTATPETGRGDQPAVTALRPAPQPRSAASRPSSSALPRGSLGTHLLWHALLIAVTLLCWMYADATRLISTGVTGGVVLGAVVLLLLARGSGGGRTPASVRRGGDLRGRRAPAPSGTPGSRRGPSATTPGSRLPGLSSLSRDRTGPPGTRHAPSSRGLPGSAPSRARTSRFDGLRSRLPGRTPPGALPGGGTRSRTRGAGPFDRGSRSVLPGLAAMLPSGKPPNKRSSPTTPGARRRPGRPGTVPRIPRPGAGDRPEPARSGPRWWPWSRKDKATPVDGKDGRKPKGEPDTGPGRRPWSRKDKPTPVGETDGRKPKGGPDTGPRRHKGERRKAEEPMVVGSEAKAASGSSWAWTWRWVPRVLQWFLRIWAALMRLFWGDGSPAGPARVASGAGAGGSGDEEVAMAGKTPSGRGGGTKGASAPKPAGAGRGAAAAPSASATSGRVVAAADDLIAALRSHDATTALGRKNLMEQWGRVQEVIADGESKVLADKVGTSWGDNGLAETFTNLASTRRRTAQTVKNALANLLRRNREKHEHLDNPGTGNNRKGYDVEKNLGG